MAQPLYIQIREIIDRTPGLSQKGLAERMGLNPAAVNRMLHGRRKISVDEIPVIESYLGVKLDMGSHAASHSIEYRQQATGGSRRGFSDISVQPIVSQAPSRLDTVPVYYAHGIGARLADWVVRHPAQAGIDDAFAIYTAGEDMEPRYFKGELVYLHPGRPLGLHQDSLIVLYSGDVLLRRVVSEDADTISVLSLKPYGETKIARKDIKSTYAVVGRG